MLCWAFVPEEDQVTHICALQSWARSHCGQRPTLTVALLLQDPNSMDEQFAFQPAARFEETMNTVFDTLTHRCAGNRDLLGSHASWFCVT